MINVSSEFKEIMMQRQDFKENAEVTFSDNTILHLEEKDFSISNNSVVDSADANAVPIGAAICRNIQFELLNDDDHLEKYDFYGAKIRLYLTFELSNTVEKIEFGTFTVTEPESYGTTVVVNAADDMYKANAAYSTDLSFPATAGAVLRDACSRCNILMGTTSFLHDDFQIQTKPSGDYTFRQVIGYIAMIACGNARINRSGKLEIMTYDLDFGRECHNLTEWKSLTMDTSDITITGIQTTRKVKKTEGENETEVEETVRAGSEGYMLTVSNPLVSGNEETLVSWIHEKISGVPFRKFTGDYITYPLAEFMDLAKITDWRGNTCNTFVTDIDFVFFGITTMKNSAGSGLRNASKYGSEDTQTNVHLQELIKQERTDRQEAIKKLGDSLNAGGGLYSTYEKQPDGSTITYLHDKPTLKESKTIIKITTEAIGVSNDGGKTYLYGFVLDGDIITKILYAHGIDADYINTGAITVRDAETKKIIFSVDIDTGRVVISGDTIEIGSRPIEEVINNGILESKNYADKLGGNLLKGAAFGENDIKTYWDVAGKIEHDIEDPSGGVYAIRLTGTVSDNFVSAKYSNNNPINTAGWYEVRVWLKAEKDMSVTISANRVAYKCAVTTKWQQFRIMLPVSTPNTQGFQNFTIGGWGSIPKDAVVYIYRPEISYSYSPDDMLDILTENGKRKGIYSKNGMLYIDGTHVRSGKVSGEYIDARNLTVTNTAGQKTLAVDNNGNVDMNVRSLSILGSAIASEAYADKQSGNLLKGGNLTESDIDQYWETNLGEVTYGQADPLGGKNAIKFYSPVIFGDGSNDETAYLSAKKSTNNPITAPGVYEARFWLKANVNKTIKISINRTQYDCAVTTSWKQYRYMLDVKTPNTTIYPSFTIGGWNSMGMDETYYIYKPEVIISYSPTDILNLLTNNGAMDGVFIRNGQLYVKGSYIDVDDLKALKATIGGLIIGASGIYKGCTSLTSTAQGIYIGTNGIRLYATDNNGNETSFTFDLAKRTAALIGASLMFKMKNFSEKAELSGLDNTVTCKYGFHVYTKREPDISDGSYDSELVFKGLPHITSGTTLVRESNSARICTASSSSKRYKDHIAMLKDSEAEKLLDIPVVWFRYKEGYLAKEDRFVDKPLPGFYAEDVFHAFPECAMQNPDTSVEDWNYRTLIPPMLKLIQNLYKEVKNLKENKS